MRVNTLYSTKEIETDQGRKMELRYYLIQDVCSVIPSGQRKNWQDEEERIRYGIRIVKREEDQEEQECLPGLSASMEKVERLLRQMIYGLVTPATAMVTADDWSGLEP